MKDRPLSNMEISCGWSVYMGRFKVLVKGGVGMHVSLVGSLTVPSNDSAS